LTSKHPFSLRSFTQTIVPGPPCLLLGPSPFLPGVVLVLFLPTPVR